MRRSFGDTRRSNGRLTRANRSEEHTSELQSRRDLVCRLLLAKKDAFRQKTSRLAGGLQFAGLLARTKTRGQSHGRVKLNLRIHYGLSVLNSIHFFFLMNRRPPRSTPFPRPSLSR